MTPPRKNNASEHKAPGAEAQGATTELDTTQEVTGNGDQSAGLPTVQEQDEDPAPNLPVPATSAALDRIAQRRAVSDAASLIKFTHDAQGGITRRVIGSDPQGVQEAILFAWGVVTKRALYAGAYDPKHPSPPVCLSVNGETGEPWAIPGKPIPHVSGPVQLYSGKAPVRLAGKNGGSASINCAGCRYNRWGSAAYSPGGNGAESRGKACRELEIVIASLGTIDGDWLTWLPGHVRYHVPPSKLPQLTGWAQVAQLHGIRPFPAPVRITKNGWQPEPIPREAWATDPEPPSDALIASLIAWSPGGSETEELANEDGGIIIPV